MGWLAKSVVAAASIAVVGFIACVVGAFVTSDADPFDKWYVATILTFVVAVPLVGVAMGLVSDD